LKSGCPQAASLLIEGFNWCVHLHVDCYGGGILEATPYQTQSGNSITIEEAASQVTMENDVVSNFNLENIKIG